MTETTDRIEKEIVLRAPLPRVWRAITDTKEFGAWFGVSLDGAFAAGRPIRGRITIPGYEHVTMEVTVEKLEPQTYFSWRWHPAAIDPKVDYSKEPTTLVEFRFAEVPEGTRLTVVESGFDKIPAARRAEAFRLNSGGWAAQVENIRRHVSG
ncbi:MAG TPA: SRPBCC family protein [Verrucomicrobiae bacterium]|nr:SRPBCC family protein [Verrucomicrobiae bacterium]